MNSMSGADMYPRGYSSHKKELKVYGKGLKPQVQISFIISNAHAFAFSGFMVSF